MGLFRILIILGLGYLLYRAVKAVVTSQGKIARTRPRGVIDEMVQDPNCKTYIPSKDSVSRTINGRRYHFCSEECADAFEMNRENSQGSGPD